MMAGTMQAPLAGLIAILELTGEPNFILPGMLAVVAATITAGRMVAASLFYRACCVHGALITVVIRWRNPCVVSV